MEQPSPDAGQKALTPRLTPAAQAKRDLVEDVYSRRLKGESVPEIAKELGLTPKRVSAIVDKEVRSRPIPSMIAYRRILLDRYEKMARRLEPHAKGEGIDPRSDPKNPQEYDRPQLGFVDRWLALQDKIGKLVGANAPVQVGVEHSGEVSHVVDASAQVSALLERMHERLRPREALPDGVVEGEIVAEEVTDGDDASPEAGTAQAI